MHYKTLVRSALACTVITLASACGSSDSTGPDYDSTVTSDDAVGAANLGYQLMNSMMSGIYSLDFGLSAEAVKGKVLANFAAMPPLTGAPVGVGRWSRTLDAGQLFTAAFPAPGLQRSASPGCTYSESGASAPGEPLDANGNNFPDDWHLQIVCLITEEGDGDTVYTSRETQDILIRERPQDLLGYELRASMSLRHQGNHGDFQEQEVRQELLLSVRSGGVTQHQLQMQGFRERLPGATETSVQEQFVSGDAGYDPFFPIVLGNPLPDGHLTLNGEVHGIDTDEGFAVRFVLDTPNPLAFDRSCAENNDQPFVDGVLRGRLNGNGHVGFRITFNPCGAEPDYETFGIDDEVPAAPKFMAPRFHP